MSEAYNLVYYFKNDTWIDDGDWEFECYNISLEHHPDLIQKGSCHSIEEIYEQIAEWEGESVNDVKDKVTVRIVEESY